jgi:hypothetical protein
MVKREETKFMVKCVRCPEGFVGSLSELHDNGWIEISTHGTPNQWLCPTHARGYQKADDDVLRKRFRQDINYLFDRAQTCASKHANPHTGFCRNCLDELYSVMTLRASVGGAPNDFILTEEDMRGLLRETFRHHISHEGDSGPALHRLLGRIRAHLPPAKYHQFLRNA